MYVMRFCVKVSDDFAVDDRDLTSKKGMEVKERLHEKFMGGGYH